MSMRRRMPSPPQPLIVALALTLIVALAGTIGVSQELSSKIRGSEQDAIRAIASALADAPDRADIVLRGLNFTEALVSAPGYGDWPALRKIETAYLSAVSGGGPQEGEKFLRTFSRVLAAEHTNAIRYEKPLKPYFPEPSAASVAVGDRTIRFQRIGGGGAKPGETVRGAILAIERYVERVPGGLQSLMAGCCNHSQADIYDILRGSASAGEAMQRAIATGKVPPAQLERLLRAIELIARNTRAVQREEALKPFLVELDKRAGGAGGFASLDAPGQHLVAREDAKLAAEVDELIQSAAKESGASPGLFGGGGAGAGVGGGGGGARNQAHYEAASRAATRSIGPGVTTPSPPPARTLPASRPTFRALRAAPRGFGGVVFGDMVDGNAVAKPRALLWVDEPRQKAAERWGRFDIVFANETVAMTRRIRTEEAWVARAIVAGIPGSFGPLDVAAGAGVGLASVVLDASAAPETPAREFLVHPALFGLPLGEAMVMADARGFLMTPEAMDRALKAAGVAEATRAKARRWVDTDHGFYKITDVPLRIVNSAGILRVERRPGPPGYPEPLRRIAFLGFQAFDDDERPLKENATPFYELVPALTAAFDDFNRLNDFAEVFALVRWARLSNARLPTTIAEPTRRPSTLFVRPLEDGSIRLESRLSLLSSSIGEILELDTKARTLLARSRAPEAATKMTADLTAARLSLAKIGEALVQIADRSLDTGARAAADKAAGVLRARRARLEKAFDLLDDESAAAVALADADTKRRLLAARERDDEFDAIVSARMPWFRDWYNLQITSPYE